MARATTASWRSPTLASKPSPTLSRSTRPILISSSGPPSRCELAAAYAACLRSVRRDAEGHPRSKAPVPPASPSSNGCDHGVDPEEVEGAPEIVGERRQTELRSDVLEPLHEK